MHQFGLDQITPVERTAREGPGPLTRDERLHVIELAGLEGFKLGGAVFVNFVGDAVKVELPLAHIQVTRPVVRIAIVGDVLAKLHTADAVRAGCNRDVHDHLVQRFMNTPFQPPLVAEHRQAAHDQGQLAVGPDKIKANAAFGQHSGFFDFTKISPVLGSGLLAGQAFKRMAHIGGQNRVAVVKSGCWMDLKRHRQTVSRDVGLQGQQTI